MQWLKVGLDVSCVMSISGERHSRLPTAHLPQRRLCLWRLDPMALDLGAFGTSAVPQTSFDFAPPHFHTPSAA